MAGNAAAAPAAGNLPESLQTELAEIDMLFTAKSVDDDERTSLRNNAFCAYFASKRPGATAQVENTALLATHFQDEAALKLEPFRKSKKLYEMQVKIVKEETCATRRDLFIARGKKSMLTPEDVFALAYHFDSTDADWAFYQHIMLHQHGQARIRMHNWHQMRDKGPGFLLDYGRAIEILPWPLFPGRVDPEFENINLQMLQEAAEADISGGSLSIRIPAAFKQRASNPSGGEWIVPVQDSPHGQIVNLTDGENEIKRQGASIARANKVIADIQRQITRSQPQRQYNQPHHQQHYDPHQQQQHRGRGGGARGNRGRGRGPRGGEHEEATESVTAAKQAGAQPNQSPQPSGAGLKPPDLPPF